MYVENIEELKGGPLYRFGDPTPTLSQSLHCVHEWVAAPTAGMLHCTSQDELPARHISRLIRLPILPWLRGMQLSNVYRGKGGPSEEAVVCHTS
jgi:hypothetical protein